MKRSSLLCLAGLAGLLLTSAATAQPEDKGAPLSKVERKSRAPVSKEVLRVQLPRPAESTLESGLTVLILEDHRLPQVTALFSISGAGGLHDPPDQPGLAQATASMLREGTATRSSKEIAEALDRLGVVSMGGAGFGQDDATFSARGLSDNLDEWFPVALDVLLHPTFPEAELGKFKVRAKVRLKQQRSDPGFLAQERFSRAVFGEHPAAIVSATPRSIDALSSAALQRWHRERYAPQNAILAIAGDVKEAELLAKLKKWTADWQRSNFKPALPKSPQMAAGKRVFLVERPDSVQTTVAMGNLGVDRRSTDYIPLVVTNRIFGGGPSARLFLNLREAKGYTYGVYSAIQALQYPGPFRAGGDMRTGVTDEALAEFLKEIGRIRDEPVPQEELEESKRSIVAAFALSLERPDQLLSYAVTRKQYNLPADYWDRYPAEVMAVTAADVKRMAQRYLDPAKLQLVAVGDGKKIRELLRKYGPLEVYDVEGRKVVDRSPGPPRPLPQPPPAKK